MGREKNTMIPERIECIISLDSIQTDIAPGN